ncbi:hypothetical protein PR048_029898 [Dryococelus australis]|uniref:Uncharacterized protein n=1 Tax=Dryococelus australis TaxID=614101 RepID=A0ABQ9G8B7_9NEOP|nr:hypothetical protein PR048_029898 [Dryococelus australis]
MDVSNYRTWYEIWPYKAGNAMTGAILAGITTAMADLAQAFTESAVRLLASHLGEPGSIPGGFASGFSHVGIVPDDAAGRRVFSGISRFPHPLISACSIITLLHPRQLSRPRYFTLHSLTRISGRNYAQAMNWLTKYGICIREQGMEAVQSWSWLMSHYLVFEYCAHFLLLWPSGQASAMLDGENYILTYHHGTTVAERLARSPSTKMNRGYSLIFAYGNRARRCRWSPGFLGYLLFPPPFHSGSAPYSPRSPSSTLKNSLLRAVQISSLTHSRPPCWLVEIKIKCSFNGVPANSARLDFVFGGAIADSRWNAYVVSCTVRKLLGTIINIADDYLHNIDDRVTTNQTNRQTNHQGHLGIITDETGKKLRLIDKTKRQCRPDKKNHARRLGQLVKEADQTNQQH